MCNDDLLKELKEMNKVLSHIFKDIVEINIAPDKRVTIITKNLDYCFLKYESDGKWHYDGWGYGGPCKI